MEIIIYTDNMQVCMNASVVNRYPAGVTLNGVYTQDQMNEVYPEAKLATHARDLYKSEMLTRKIQVCNPIKFKQELERATVHPHGLKVALGFHRSDYEFLLYNFTGKGLFGATKNRLHRGQVPGLFWQGWKEMGMTEEEYLKERGTEE